MSQRSISLILCRDCWPVYDKKLEQQFRKACSNWLTRIAKVGYHAKCKIYNRFSF